MTDIELTIQPQRDPLGLTSKRLSTEQLDRVAPNTFRKRSSLRKFYKDQNEQIDRFIKPVDEHVREAKEQELSDGIYYKIATRGSLIANCCLAVLQIYGASSSGSLSLFATMADAIFDPLSNLNLVFWQKSMSRVDKDKYPSGKSRFEPVGNIVFCWIMSAVSAVLIAISCVELVQGIEARKSGDEPKAESFHIPSIVAVAVAFCVKLALFLFCWPLRKRYSVIQILWADHRNDIFINGFGLLTSSLGSKIAWWIDPAGAIILSVVVIIIWARESVDHFKNLVGVTCDRRFLQHVTYLALTHSEDIKAVDTVRAYHSGPRLIVEVDVVMDPEQPLKVAHDCAEDLQIKLERLPDVERAFVHIDYETSHAPEHFLKKIL